jgi:hypothetical protein
VLCAGLQVEQKQSRSPDEPQTAGRGFHGQTPPPSTGILMPRRVNPSGSRPPNALPGSDRKAIPLIAHTADTAVHCLPEQSRLLWPSESPASAARVKACCSSRSITEACTADRKG